MKQFFEKHFEDIIRWGFFFLITGALVYAFAVNTSAKTAKVYRKPTTADSVCAASLVEAGYIVISPEEQEAEYDYPEPY